MQKIKEATYKNYLVATGMSSKKVNLVNLADTEEYKLLA
jgi:hypothetical protein